VSETFLLKGGIQRLYTRLGITDEERSPANLPRWPNGSSKLLKSSFFTRLLREDVVFRALLANEVSGAQGDLKHLTWQQLLFIRVQALDFTAEAQTHQAHNNFFTTLERFLFKHLAKHTCRFLERQTGDEVDTLVHDDKMPSQDWVLQRLGEWLALMIGATAALESQQDSSTEAAGMPKYWLRALGEDDWQGYRAVLIFVGSEELPPWIMPFAGDDSQSLLSATDGALVAVLSDCSGGRSIGVHWEIDVIDPSTTDAFEELRKTSSRRNGMKERDNFRRELSTRLSGQLSGRG